ncbi:MAG: SUMF1/EgtB/PvdO family nonheme iron enzyme [Myxococcota bacterium]
MRHMWIVVLMGMVGWLWPTEAFAQTLTLMVSPFNNNTPDEQFHTLEKGLADMLITDLSVSEDFKLVERERLETLLKELKLNASSLVDPRTAQKSGRVVGADLVLAGSIQAASPILRLDARIIDVEEATIVATAKASGPIERFFEVEASLAKELLDAMGVALTPLQRLKVQKAPTKNLEAFNHYTDALDAADRGDPEAETKALEAAIEADPSFAKAIARLDARIAALEGRTDAVERAGGLILRPTTPADYWSNHQIHVDRRETAKAVTALQNLLKLAPSSLDGLEQYVRLAKPSKRSAIKGVDPTVLAAVTAIVNQDAKEASVQTRQRLVEAPDDPVARWLRLRALTAPLNPSPTALEAAELWRHVQVLSDPVQADTFTAAFTVRPTADAAQAQVRALLEAGDKAVSSAWPIRRRYVVAPPVTLAFVWEYRHSIEVRIAEANPQNASIEWPGGLVTPLAFQNRDGLGGTAAILVAKLDERFAETVPRGPQRVTVRWRDGKGHDVATTFGAFLPPRSTGVSDNNWERIQLGFNANKERKGQILVDTIASVWTAPRAEAFQRLSFEPGWETPPGAWGLAIRNQSAAVTRTGLARPFAFRYADPAADQYGAVGLARFQFEKRSDERRGRWKADGESWSYERGLASIPLRTDPLGGLVDLVAAGEAEDALEMLVTLAYRDGEWGAVPDWSTTDAGAYRLTYLLAAAKRLNRRYGALRSAVTFGSQVEARDWLREVVQYLDGAITAKELVALAKARDGEDHRFQAEAATAIALSDPKAHKEMAEFLRAMTRHATPNMIEWTLLRQEVRKQRMTLPPQVRSAGRFVDRMEVTVDDYLQCVKAGRCRRPSSATCAQARGEWSGGWTDHMGTACFPVEDNPYPITWITHDQAASYCDWRGGALPTAKEWTQLAARTTPFTAGDDNLMEAHACAFSWVSLAPKVCKNQRANFEAENPHDGYLGIAPVGAFPAGASADGVENLLGNVREWLRDGTVAGCDYNDPPGTVKGPRCANRIASPRTRASGTVGFRCTYGRPPRPPSSLGKRQRPPRTKRGSVPLTWVGVPAGTLDPKTMPQPIVIDLSQPAPADLDAAVARIDGLSRADLDALIKRFRKAGLTSTINDHDLSELVHRSRSWKRSLADTVSLVLELIEPPEPDRDTDAAEDRARKALGASIYASGAQSHWLSEHREVDRASMTKAQWREALFEYLFHYPQSDFGFEDRQMFTLRRTQGLPRPWHDRVAPGCLEYPDGQCLDLTGTKTSDRDGSLRAILQSYTRRDPIEVPAFELLAHEVTQDQYRKVTGQDPSFEWCADCPVTQVSATEAEAFCTQIGGRLPTNAEWRWAVLAGGPPGLRPGPVEAIAWSLLNSEDQRPKPVGTRKVNGYGLYDMLGNVWEWTTDPTNRDEWERHVVGGSWASDPRQVHPRHWVTLHQRVRSDFIGFRCAR